MYDCQRYVAASEERGIMPGGFGNTSSRLRGRKF